jgi:hypothetical protein
MTNAEIQELFEKACKIAAKQKRSGSGNHIIVHPKVAEGIADALKMRDRLMKLKKITDKI